MTTAILSETESPPLASALDDIAQFGPQFIHEQDIYGIDVAHGPDGVTIRLSPGEAGNRFPCTTEFQIETPGDALRITVTERFGATGTHQAPMLTLDADDQKARRTASLAAPVGRRLARSSTPILNEGAPSLMPKDSIPLGWCLAGQHDVGEERGACPVVSGYAGPCSCPCHDGATDPRGFIDAELRAHPDRLSRTGGQK